MERKQELDNIRWITVVLVMVYHVIYIFNSQGVLSNFPVQGIKRMDIFLYLVYPWFMVLLFVVAGVSAKYALKTRSAKAFAKDRFLRLLIPSVVIMFLLGWICGLVSNYYSDIFNGNHDKLPGIIRYVIYSFCGIGPLWFARELFLASMVLLLVRKLDRKDRLSNLCGNIKWWGFIILYLSFWGSSFLLNTPYIEVYRNGIYINSFLMGYYIFSNESIVEKLRKIKKILVPVSCVCAVGYCVYICTMIEPQATDNIFTTVNYTSMSVLRHPFTNLYAFLMILTVFSVAKDWLAFRGAFAAFMTKANFGYYALHYPCLCVVAFVSYEKLHLPIWSCYLVNLIGMLLLTTILYMVLSRIPVLKSLTLGIYERRVKKDVSESRSESKV